MSGDGERIVVGRVVTMDPARPSAEAVVIRGDRIAFVGSAAEARDFAPGAAIIDAGDGTVLPAFHDAHVHPIHGGLAKLQCDLHDASTFDESRELVRSYAAAHPGRPWILGSGWAMDAFPRGNPRREDLDDIVPDRPVALTSRDVHSVWANTRALEAAGIGADTPDPPSGVIVRDEHGAPSGALHEDAMNLVLDAAPKPTLDERLQALILAQDELHSLGIVSWQDAWVEPSELETYIAAASRGRLTMHPVLSLMWQRERDASQLADVIAMRDAALDVGVTASTVKIFIDGIVESFTALLLEPYLDGHGRSTDERGMERIPRAQLLDYATAIDAAAFQLHFHAIGDGAVRLGLDAVEAVRATNGPRDARHHIAHIQIVNPADIPRFAALDAIPNAQPLWAYLDDQMRELNVPFLGPERTQHQYPFASLLRSGARLAMGSDWPVSSPDPLLEMEVAVRRRDPDAPDTEPFIPREALTADQALAGFTTNSAFVNRLDDSGRLLAGGRADVIVLDRDIHALDDGRLSEASVSVTIAAGRVVHG